MIKARGTKPDGGEFVLLGLSHGNLDRLRNGEPIMFDGRPYGIPMDVVIMAGETEARIAAMLTDENTEVKFER
jgi:hypothetical protein